MSPATFNPIRRQKLFVVSGSTSGGIESLESILLGLLAFTSDLTGILYHDAVTSPRKQRFGSGQFGRWLANLTNRISVPWTMTSGSEYWRPDTDSTCCLASWGCFGIILTLKGLDFQISELGNLHAYTGDIWERQRARNSFAQRSPPLGREECS